MAASSPHVLVLHGPNLNLLGSREPGHYGQTTLAEIDAGMRTLAQGWGWRLHSLQSNAEHVLIDAVQEALPLGVTDIIINPAAFTHTSVALRDALAAVQIPFIEVHLSNIHGREPFRRHSYFSELAQGVIAGLGADGYFLALDAIHRRMKRHNP
ncbi:MAG: type II 3-dehydroquinate dehydratase [Acidithiobacillus ferrooxidans]|nr:type II 3-dehydroquinate dehydratase [Acidithiobacillus ferrooxidans]MDD5577565.1 type II 3-dehydroquinate dehydratase [Acidithiobacillus sp.]